MARARSTPLDFEGSRAPSAPPSRPPASGIAPRGSTEARSVSFRPAPVFRALPTIDPFPTRSARSTGVVGGPDFSEDELDTSVLTLSPEFLAAIRGIAPRKRRTAPLVAVLVLVAAAAAIAWHRPARETFVSFVAQRWRRQPSVGTQTSPTSSTGAPPRPAVSAAPSPDLIAESAKTTGSSDPDLVALPPVEVPPTTGTTDSVSRRAEKKASRRAIKRTASTARL